MHGLAFSSNGQKLLTYHGGLRVWDLSEPIGAPRVFAASGGCARTPVLSADGNEVACASFGSVLLWRTSLTEPIRLETGAEKIARLSFSRDGHWLAGSSHTKIIMW